MSNFSLVEVRGEKTQFFSFPSKRYQKIISTIPKSNHAKEKCTTGYTFHVWE